MRFVLVHQASTYELLLTFVDQCLHVFMFMNLHSICSSYKVIVSLQKIWTKMLDSYGIVVQIVHELYETTNGSFIKISGNTL